MTNRKGADFERVIADYLKDRWSEFIDRRVKTGTHDKGDIANFRVGKQKVVIECKNTIAMTIGKDLKEAQTEADNDNAFAGILVKKRAGKGQPQDQYVITTLGTFLDLLDAATDAGGGS
jgi:Holliday junction resolvase